MAELPLEGAGARLLRAREAKGLTRAQLAGLTKIPERHLGAIEQGNFSALPATTYAMGFSRTYARAVGLDEREIVQAVRDELAEQQPATMRRAAPAFEPGDPARVPSARLAWLGTALALMVVIAGLVFWRSYYAPGGDLPSLLPSDEPSAAAAGQGPPLAQPASGAVVFTALEPAIWVKFYDGAGVQILQKELALGESFTVPANIPDVRLWTARPEALAIAVNGQPVPKLADEQRMMKDVPVTAAALLARQQPVVMPSFAPTRAAERPRPNPPSRTRAADPVVKPMVRPVEIEPVPATTPPAAPLPATTAADR